MAVKANLVIDQGSDFSVSVDLTDANNDPYDLTNHTIASQMRKNYASSSAAATFSTSHNGAGGTLVLELTANTTVDLVPGRYFYDVEIKSSSNTINRVLEGIVTVTPGMTRNL